MFVCASIVLKPTWCLEESQSFGNSIFGSWCTVMESTIQAPLLISFWTPQRWPWHCPAQSKVFCFFVCFFCLMFPAAFLFGLFYCCQRCLLCCKSGLHDENWNCLISYNMLTGWGKIQIRMIISKPWHFNSKFDFYWKFILFPAPQSPHWGTWISVSTWCIPACLVSLSVICVLYSSACCQQHISLGSQIKHWVCHTESRRGPAGKP